MGEHRTGYSVGRIITIAYQRDPRVMGIVAGTIYSTLALGGIHLTFDEACGCARALRDGLYVADVHDGVRQQRVGGEV